MVPGNRKHYRLSIKSPLAFKIIKGKNPEEKSPPFKGMLKDISLGGLQFGTNILNYKGLYVFNEFEMKQDLNFKPNLLLIKFTLPGEKDPFIVYCHPRWYSQGDLVDPFEYYIGARYIRITKADLLRISNYIRRHGDIEDLRKYYQKRKGEETKGKVQEVEPQKYAVAVVPLRYRIISGQSRKQSRPKEAKTRNLSITGLCAMVETMDIDNLNMVFDDTPLKRNSILLEIFIPGQEKPLTAIGEVRWFERSKSSESKYNYHVGIKFLKITEKDKSIIAEYIKDKPEEVTELKRVW